MKKSILAVVAILLSFSALSAQEFKPFFVTVQGGPNASMNEYTEYYFKNNVAGHLIDLANGGITAGYYFNNILGARLACEYGSNHGATMGTSFQEFTFKNVSAFADIIFSGVPMNSEDFFYWRIFAGTGFGHSMGFADNSTYNNFGFRWGINLEFMVTKSLGIVVEGINEWYTDAFNGIVGGRPLDGRLTANAGLAFHF